MAGSPATSISTGTTNDGLTPRPTTFVPPLVQSLKVRSRRATRACLACRSRKVRCNVTQNYPCKRPSVAVWNIPGRIALEHILAGD